MEQDKKCRWHHYSGKCALWLAGWLFTLGYLQLPLMKAIFAIVVWPYYLGADWGGY